MSENQEPTAVPEVQQPVAAPDFSAQVDLLKAKNQELIGERRNDRKLVEDLQQQLNELQASSQKQKQAKLQEHQNIRCSKGRWLLLITSPMIAVLLQR